MKITIKRSEWLRGEGADESRLLRYGDQKMCCLGFYLEACGIPRTDFQGWQAPSELGHPLLVPAWLLVGSANSSDCVDLMISNDSTSLVDSVREEEIAKRFLLQGVEVEFVD